MGYSYFYSPRGYVIDFNDFNLLETFTKELKKFAKSNKAIFIKIDPDVKRHDLDVDGNIIGNDNSRIIDKLKSLGYHHKGYNIDFVNEQPRFTFRLDLRLDFDTIYSNFHATTRKILNKKNEYELITYKGDISDIDNLRKIYNNKIEDINNKINSLKEKDGKKSLNKIKELENELNKVKKDLSLVPDKKEVVLSSIMTVKYNDKVWTVHGGNENSLRHLNSNYWLCYNIIKDAYDNNYKVIDFFGTSGQANPPKDSPIYGIHNFKKRLGGEYIEFIGEFDLVCNKFMYIMFNTLIPIRRKIIRRRLKNV